MKIYKMFNIHPSMETLDLGFIPPESPWHDNILSWGVEITEDKPLPIEYIYISNAELGDWPSTTNGGMLISNKFSAVLKKISSHCQIFPAVIYKDTKLITKDYISFVLTVHLPAINWEKSQCRNLKGFARSISKLVLSNEKIKSLPPSIKIFRMSENTNLILVTEEAKNAIEEAGIQDVAFKEVEIA